MESSRSRLIPLEASTIVPGVGAGVGIGACRPDAIVCGGMEFGEAAVVVGRGVPTPAGVCPRCAGCDGCDCEDTSPGRGVAVLDGMAAGAAVAAGKTEDVPGPSWTPV